jgi:NADH dehydrogenase FAD-containing subunit
MARKQIVILGGGTGGTMAANRLRRRFDSDEAEIHVVDRDDRHVYQPGLLFVPFGLAEPAKLVRSRRAQLRRGIAFHEREVESVSLEQDEVLLGDGTTLPYDVLVVAGGDGGPTPGLTFFASATTDEKPANGVLLPRFCDPAGLLFVQPSGRRW